MEIYQLKTFVTVAREGSITHASEYLFLSQPAVSAHIKALEEELGLILFERTPRGMSVTENGRKLLLKADQLIALHRDFLSEAKIIKGQLSGRLRLGCHRNPNGNVLGGLLSKLADAFPDVNVELEFGTSANILNAVHSAELDAGFCADIGNRFDDLKNIQVGKFGVMLAAPPGWVEDVVSPDWQKLAQLPWVCPAPNSCCNNVAETLFEQRGFRPAKMVNVDHEAVTRTLIAGGIGIGLLHTDTAREAEAKGEVQLIGGALQEVKLLFVYRHKSAHDPIMKAVIDIVQAAVW